VEQRHATTVLMGFNRVEFARKVPIELWEGRTFYQTAKRMEMMEEQSPSDVIILNPCVGPEAITGSSRMKVTSYPPHSQLRPHQPLPQGGSATKIMLEAAFALAISKVFACPLMGLELKSSGGL